jgi:hypothetical protein
MRLETSQTEDAEGRRYSVCYKASSQPMQIIITDGRKQYTSTKREIKVSLPALFRPTWFEVREALRKKLQAKVTVYADDSSVVQGLKPDLLERSWASSCNHEGMSEPIAIESLESATKEPVSAPSGSLVNRLLSKKGR